MPSEMYRVVGIRTDDSRRILVNQVSEKMATKIAGEVAVGVFVSVVVELDACVPSSSPTSNGQRSVELFPESVQPPGSDAAQSP